MNAKNAPEISGALLTDNDPKEAAVSKLASTLTRDPLVKK